MSSARHAIEVQDLGKTYRRWDGPWARAVEAAVARAARPDGEPADGAGGGLSYQRVLFIHILVLNWW